MQLRITLRLLTGDHLIGCISEEALQAAEERIVITERISRTNCPISKGVLGALTLV